MYFCINCKGEKDIVTWIILDRKGSFLTYETCLLKKISYLGQLTGWLEAIDEDFARLSNVVALPSPVKYSDSLFVNGRGRG